MDNFFLLALVISGGALLWLLLEALVHNVAAELQYVLNRLTEIRADICDAPYRRVDNRRKRAWTAAREYERRQKKEASTAEFQVWLEKLLGIRDSASAIDRELLEAMNQTPTLRRLVQEELPQTIKRCVATHRLLGMAEGATYFYEIALRPECFKLRERVIHLNRAAVEMLEGYPKLVDDPVLMQNLAVIRSRIGPICRNCPYLHYEVNRAPLLCPSAELVVPAEEVSNENGEQAVQ